MTSISKNFVASETKVASPKWKRISKNKNDQGGYTRKFENRSDGRIVEMIEDENGMMSITADSKHIDPTKTYGGMLVSLAYKLDDLKDSNPSPKDVLDVIDAVGFDKNDEQFIALSKINPFKMDDALDASIFSSEEAIARIMEVTHYRVINDGDTSTIEFSDALGLRGGDNGLFLGLIEERMNNFFQEHGLDIEGGTENSISVSGDYTSLSSALLESGLIWANGENNLVESGFISYLKDALTYKEIHGTEQFVSPRGEKTKKKSSRPK